MRTWLGGNGGSRNGHRHVAANGSGVGEPVDAVLGGGASPPARFLLGKLLFGQGHPGVPVAGNSISRGRSGAGAQRNVFHDAAAMDTGGVGSRGAEPAIVAGDGLRIVVATAADRLARLVFAQRL